jgi:NADPH-dependent curcumin reductase CurA
MSTQVNRQLRLANRPKGPVEDDTFALHEASVPDVADGEFLVRTIYTSIDPAQRGNLIDVPSYTPAVQIGEVMRAAGVGRVISSRHPGFREGELVSGPLGWQEFCLGGEASAPNFAVVAAGIEPRHALSVLGGTGLTAYFGLLAVGRPAADETVVVSGAAGATGSIAGQIARLKGCRVIGTAGAVDKCAWLTEELGFHGAINYREERVGRRLRELCPGGVDVMFDNVGGAVLDSVLLAMNVHGRIAVCGTISSGYNEGSRGDPIVNYFLLAPRRIRMEGFLVSDFRDQWPQAREELTAWLQRGDIKTRETIYEGLESAPRALREIFMGANTGKLLVRVGSAD